MTLIFEKSGRATFVGSNDSPGVVVLENLYLRVEKHPSKEGHYVGLMLGETEIEAVNTLAMFVGKHVPREYRKTITGVNGKASGWRVYYEDAE